MVTACYRLKQSTTLIYSHHITRFTVCEAHVALKWRKKTKQKQKTSGVWVCERVLFLLFSAFLEPAHVLPVCMINLFSLIIYVIQNVIYVIVNFELWPKRWIVNLSSQTLSEYTFVHSLVSYTHKSPQTGADVHTLAFFHRSWRLQIRRKIPVESTCVEVTQRNGLSALNYSKKNFNCKRYRLQIIK